MEMQQGPIPPVPTACITPLCCDMMQRNNHKGAGRVASASHIHT
jgi:hypothetical protein